MEDQETIREIFGEKPRFIYFPEGVDPMIIPWQRARIIAEELFEEATVAAANKDFAKAEQILTEIRQRYPETEQGQMAPNELVRVAKLRQEEENKAKPQGEKPPEVVRGPEPDGQRTAELPDWIRNNTTGIMLSDDKTVIVGDDFLAVGQSVPRYPTVRVKSINASEVTFVYQDKEFTLEVDGSF
jgi:hypothetical protein